MGLKIKNASPFFPDYIKEIDFDDFEKIDVGIKGEKNSNHFLWQLWHLFDVQYAPVKEKVVVPWAFMPRRYNGKKNLIIVLGDINTSLGNFLVAISCVRKGDIDSICFYSGWHNDKSIKQKLRVIVGEALNKIDEVESFHFRVELCSKFEKLKFATYIGERFKIYTMNEKVYVAFDVLCADRYEAYHLGMERLKYFSAFLSVETNIVFDYEPIDLCAEKDNIDSLEMMFMQNFIDDYSIVNDEVVLSDEAFNFLNQYVFVERDLDLDKVSEYFLLACIHVYDGIKEEDSLDDNVRFTFPKYSVSAAKIQLKDKQEKYTHCIMHYLSAIETASYSDGNHETCETCGNVKYKIGARVKDFTTKYFNEEVGKLFKGLYSIRSKYLHTGTLSTSGDFLNARPLLDCDTDSGLIDHSFISVKVSGNIALVYANNVKEITTFCLRCYYHEKFFGNTNFYVDGIYNNNTSSYISHFSGIKIIPNREGLQLISIEPE